MRLNALPDTPPIADFVPDVELSRFYGAGAPKNTPTEIINDDYSRIFENLGAGRKPALRTRLTESRTGGTGSAVTISETARVATVFVLTASSTSYDSIRGILNILGDEFSQLGHHVLPVDLDVNLEELKSCLKLVAAHCQQRHDSFALTLSGLGADMRVDDGRLFWDLAQVPYLTWYCDHPSYFVSRHKLESNYITHAYVFPDHAKFNRDYLKANGAAFAVHMGIPDPHLFAHASDQACNGRIIFAKSGWNPAALARDWRETLPPQQFKMLFEMIEASTGVNCIDFASRIIEVADRYSIYLSPGGDLFNFFLTRVDNYIRALKTTLLASVLIDYPVDFFGSGWDYIRPDATKASFFGPVRFDDLVHRLPDYLGAASVNPNVEFSVHDRVFFAISAGVVPIFDSNTFSRAHMPTLEPYSFSYNRESIAAAVEALFAEPALAQERVHKTFAALYPTFSMRSAVQQIFEIRSVMCGRKGAPLMPVAPAPANVWTPRSAASAA